MVAPSQTARAAVPVEGRLWRHGAAGSADRVLHGRDLRVIAPGTDVVPLADDVRVSAL